MVVPGPQSAARHAFDRPSRIDRRKIVGGNARRRERVVTSNRLRRRFHCNEATRHHDQFFRLLLAAPLPQVHQLRCLNVAF
jgi:hypothetical protein